MVNLVTNYLLRLPPFNIESVVSPWALPSCAEVVLTAPLLSVVTNGYEQRTERPFNLLSLPIEMPLSISHSVKFLGDETIQVYVFSGVLKIYTYRR